MSFCYISLLNNIVFSIIVTIRYGYTLIARLISIDYSNVSLLFIIVRYNAPTYNYLTKKDSLC